MDKDRIAGAAKQAKGAVKDAINKVTGDATSRAGGESDKVEGKVKNVIAGARNAARDVLKK